MYRIDFADIKIFDSEIIGVNFLFSSLEMVHIPIWLLVAGILVLAVPAVYFVYDAFCKPEDVNPGEDYEDLDDDYGKDYEDQNYEDYEDVPAVYFVYDAFCKPEDVNPGDY